MNVTVAKGLLEETKANVLVVNLFEGVKVPAGATGAIDIALGGLISDYVIAKEGFDGKFGSMYVLPTFGKLPAEKIIIAGMGKSKDFTLNKLRELSARIIKKCAKLPNAKKVVSILHGAGIGGYDPQICAQMITEGVLIGGYKFDKYKSDKKQKKIDEVVIVDMVEEHCKKAKAGVKKGKIIASAVNFARNLANEPAQYATPAKLAEIAQSLKDIDVRVYEKDEIEKMLFRSIAKNIIGENEKKIFYQFGLPVTTDDQNQIFIRKELGDFGVSIYQKYYDWYRKNGMYKYTDYIDSFCYGKIDEIKGYLDEIITFTENNKEMTDESKLFVIEQVNEYKAKLSEYEKIKEEQEL